MSTQVENIAELQQRITALRRERGRALATIEEWHASGSPGGSPAVVHAYTMAKLQETRINTLSTALGKLEREREEDQWRRQQNEFAANQQRREEERVCDAEDAKTWLAKQLRDGVILSKHWVYREAEAAGIPKQLIDDAVAALGVTEVIAAHHGGKHTGRGTPLAWQIPVSPAPARRAPREAAADAAPTG